MQEIGDILTEAPGFLLKSSLYFQTIDYIYKTRYFNFKIHIVLNADNKIYCFRIVRTYITNKERFGNYDTIFFSLKIDDIWNLFTREQQKYFAYHLDLLLLQGN